MQVRLPAIGLRASTLDHAAPFATAVLVASFVSATLRVLPRYFPHAALPALPHTLPRLPSNLDAGVVVLFVPLCALMLALMIHAARLVGDGALPDELTPHARPIPHWQDAGS